MNRSGSIGRVLRFLGPPAVLLAGIGGFVALARSREHPEPRVAETPPPLVETVVVSETADAFDLEADGVVVPFRSVTLAAEVEGRVVNKSENCRAGKTVKAGELLLRIDPATYQLQVKRLTSEREQALASLDELAVQVANAEASIAITKEEVALRQADFLRIAELEKRGVSTQQAHDAARRDELISRTALVKLENEKRLLQAQQARLEQVVELSEVQLAQASLDLERTEIRAPADGVIVSVSVEEQGYLRKGDAILDFEDTSAVEVRASLEMRALAWMRAHWESPDGQTPGPYDIPPVPVTLTYELFGNTYSWHGVLSRVDGIGVDERTRTIPCRVLIDKPRDVSLRNGNADLPVAAPPALIRGMYVKVLLHTTPSEPLLSVPEIAVRPGSTVWAVRDGKLEHFKLPAARVVRGAVLVSRHVTGLRPGDQVVVSPLPVATEGMAVRADAPPDVELPGVPDESLWASSGRRPAEKKEIRR